MKKTIRICDISEYPVDHGRYLIEASAGTGKTYTITHLVLRLILKGVPVRRILVTTFSRAAADELKKRILELLDEELNKLVPKREQDSARETGDGEDACLPGLFASSGEDAGSRTGKEPSPEDLRTRILLKLAVSSIDEMTVSTIHGFCQKMLCEFALKSGRRFESEVVQNETRYTDRLARAFCRSRFYGGDPRGAAEYGNIIEAARFASEPIDCAIPGNNTPEGPDLYYSAYCFVRERLQAEKDRDGVLSSNDMIRDLEAALRADDRLAEMIRSRYQAVFVDEFQDTDRLQYRIFDKCFPRGGSALFYMIGDPKQAIYGFRGADIYTYLHAKNNTDEQYTLTKNFRSSPGMVEAVNLMFGDGTLEEGYETDGVFLQEGIPFVSIKAGNKPEDFPDSCGGNLRVKHYFGTKSECKGRIEEDVVREIRYLLSEDCPMQVFVKKKRLDGKEEKAPERLRASDIAILVQSHAQAADFVAMLNREGIAASACKSGKIYDTDEARLMLLLLRCFLHPDAQYVRGLMLSPFFRVSCGDVIARPSWGEQLMRQMAEHGRAWSQSGIPAAFLQFLDTPFLDGVTPRSRILSEFNGERMITNYIQLMELLFAEESENHLLPEDVFNFLNRAVNGGDADDKEDASEDNPDQLRLDRDSASVQIMTMFAAKGLEFPVVFVPYPAKTDWKNLRKGEIAYRFNAAAAKDGGDARESGGGIILDFSRNGSNLEIVRSEEFRNNLRLLYVALTRASLVTYLYTQQLPESAASSRAVNFTNSVQGVLLMSHGRCMAGSSGTDGATDQPGKTVVEQQWNAGYFSGTADVLPRPPADWWTSLDEPGAGADESFHVSRKGVFERHFGIRGGIGALRPENAPESLEAAVFAGDVRDDWSIMSFSAFHNVLNDRADTETETPADLDERNDALSVEAGGEDGEDAPDTDLSSSDRNIFRDFPHGTTVGSMTHKLLENCAGHFDLFVSAGQGVEPDMPDAIRSRIADVFREFGYDFEDETLAWQLFDGVSRTLQIPLPGIGIPLSGLRQDRMVPEMEFFLDAPASLDIGRIMATLSASASVQARKLVSRADIVCDRKGILNGIIDLVFEHEGKYYIVDWKTNWLGGGDADYAPARVRAAMGNAGYILQSYLYSAALLQMLRQRGMDYGSFGGVYYFFLRGMKRGTQNGIWSDVPPRDCLENLLALFRNPSRPLFEA